ncbi:hypothetical protein [Demequina sp.]|uniref:hypothetical protein n=1 Tax=Demequina sp. TaxID=2050685 RepID=UPI0025E68E56|nr:hypothetical protein [Demequina sp.]
MDNLTGNDLYLQSRAAGLDAAAERRRAQLERIEGTAPVRRRSLRDWFARPARPAVSRFTGRAAAA